MAKKRHLRRNSRSRSGRYTKGQRNKPDTRDAENRILRVLYQANAPMSLPEIARAVAGKRRADADLAAQIQNLVRAGMVSQAGKKMFGIAENAPLYSGPMHLHPKGFGFVAAGLEHDVYISSRRTATAMHGDRVLIRLRSPKDSNRPEGAVITILERGPNTVAGFFREYGAMGLVIPEDSRFPFSIQVKRDNYADLQEGDVVIASFTPPETAEEILSGAIVEHLGPPENIDVQMRLVIEKYRLPHLFSNEALADAESKGLEIKAGEREDLRAIPHVTIDGETAKDFDDAIAVEKNGDTFRLYVSIADVSNYVKSGSSLDTEAYQRGTSIYFPGRVIPMLPEKLSNDLCSLVPEQDRLTVTAILDFDQTGKRVNKQFCRSVIKSWRRFTYTEVNAILTGQAEATAEDNPTLLEMLKHGEELAKALMAMRTERGSIGFTIPEPEILLKNDGTIDTIRKAERNFAHKLIEEFMLAANEAVAETFSKNKRKSLYRIHELPDRAKVFEFATFAATLGLEIPKPELTPQWFGKVLEACRESSSEYVVNNLLLRTMQQARYSMENKGHFALAAEDYTHFTSPIRRYPDLLVHRELCRVIKERKTGKIINNKFVLQEENGEFLSGRERCAIDAEREINDRLKLLYIEKHLGEKFDAIISGVTDFAIFVELSELFISGSIPLEELGDDYYLYDGKNHRIMGEISGITYQIGDSITVTATRVDKNKTRIIFTPTMSE